MGRQCSRNNLGSQAGFEVVHSYNILSATELKGESFRASAQDLAIFDVRGTTSTHLVFLSIIVMTCVWLSALVVRGPTKSS